MIVDIDSCAMQRGGRALSNAGHAVLGILV
ncbi:MAG: hypothetical protein JWR25_1421, partial [Noviherbaspirillum sp.]|nr:hypothetical protein [Noviherbaspirillum sp.]